MMSLRISDIQKELLHKAVDTGNAAFIARCVFNVKEIFDALRIISTEDENCDRGSDTNPISLSN